MREEDRLEHDRGHDDGIDASGWSEDSVSLSVEEFSDQFRGAFRILWTIAAGIVKDRSLAEDIVQEAAVVALQKREQFEPGTNFTAWMGQMVRFIAMNHYRKENRRGTSSQESELLERGTRFSGEIRKKAGEGEDGGLLRLDADFNLPEGQAHFDDEMVRALNEVHPEGRSCLLLRVVEGLDYKEIARILDIPIGTAMSHVHRTRQVLRERMVDVSSRSEKSFGELPRD